jgi:hypothetical protein
MEILIAILLVVITAVIFFSCGRKREKSLQQEEERKIDQRIQEEERLLKQEIERERKNLAQIRESREKEEEYLLYAEERRKERREEIEEELEHYKALRLDDLNQQVELEYQLSREKIKQNIKDLAQKENSRLETELQQNRQDFEAKKQSMDEEIESTAARLLEYRKKQYAAIEDAKRAEEKKTQSSFYMLQISNDDLADIKELKLVEKRLAKKEVLNKLIYKVYFEKPYTDLVGRVVGKETKTGIYKITNTLDNRVYIGQAVNIAERWKQHIKRALGAEPMTQNKLYPAMRDEGVWYFTFEIVEVCEKAQLNEREQYWQEFFGAKEFGYSIK